jgi:hypothetical protein
MSLSKISDLISRAVFSGEKIAAILMPRFIAVKIAEEIFQDKSSEHISYIKLVNSGGYIGKLLSTPIIVASDVVICSLSQADLTLSASRLGVKEADLIEIRDNDVL